MNEPSFNSVSVDLAKIRDYCLSDLHARGRHKARVFRSRLGLTVGNSEMLRNELLKAVRENPERLDPVSTDQYGQRYILDFSLTTPTGTAIIRSAWIVLTGENVLKLTSCYVL